MMSHRCISLALATLAALPLGACASTSSQQERAGSPSRASHEFVQGPHVATGTSVRVRLSRPLDLSSSTEGGEFDGVVQDDLRTEQGLVLVRSGAAVHGRVAWSSRNGRVALRAAQVESPVGALEMHATLVGIGQPADATAGSTIRTGAPDQSRASVPLARRPGEAAPDAFRGRIASDTDLTLQLTRPILAPNAHVYRE